MALLLRVVTSMKILITSPLILKTWKPHLFSHSSNHRLSLRDSHMHLLMLPIASTCFFTNLTISSVHRMLCNGCWMIIVHTPPHRWRIFKSKSLLSPLRLKTWQARTSTFDHSNQKKGVVVSWGEAELRDYSYCSYCFFSCFMLLFTMLYFKAFNTFVYFVILCTLVFIVSLLMLLAIYCFLP